MVERLSGRDQGTDVKRDSVRHERARRDAILQLRRALLWAAEAGSGVAAPGPLALRSAPGVLPYSERLSRVDFLRSALGNPALLHSTEVTLQDPSRGPRTHVYLDVSGSMERHLPLVYAALRPLTAYLHPEVHLFSTCIADVDLSELRRGVRVGTGGTNVAPVTQHMLDKGVKRALFITDGWVGTVPDEHARKLADRRTRVAVAVTHGGATDFARRLKSRIWHLPSLELHP